MSERSEEARASGLLVLTIGGRPVELPVLRIRQAREWRRRLDETEAPEGTGDLDRATEVMLDLVCAYDVTGVLGGRESVEDRATDPEVYAAFKAVMAAAFPFVERPESILADEWMRKAIMSLYLRGGSTSSPSASGGSRRTRSRKGSPTSSSSSSGTRGRNG